MDEVHLPIRGLWYVKYEVKEKKTIPSNFNTFKTARALAQWVMLSYIECKIN